MRSYKILLGVAALGSLVWACGDTDTTPNDTGSGADAGKDSSTATADSATGDDSTGDDSTGDDDSNDASSNLDSSTNPDGSVIADASTDAKVDSGVADSGYDAGVYWNVGGTLSGLTIAAGSQVVLQNNLGDDLTRTTNGAFTFATKVGQGAAYSVTVKTQPTTPPQTCNVTMGSGNVGAGDVSSVSVSCALSTFNVGGSVSGLRGTLVLQNNAGDDKSITTTGAFNFATKVTTGLGYAATIKTQPDGQWCKITSASGTVGAADVADIAVTCVDATNCNAIHTLDGAAATGSYVIDTDGAGATASMNAYCEMTTAGGGWTQVFDHDISKGYRAYDQWASVNPTQPNSGLYSILTSVSSLKSGANYEFRMNWPTGTAAVVGKSVMWTQVQDPTAVTDASVVTISNVTMDPTSQTGCAPFAGLAKKSNTSYLSGERSGCWWFSIGAAAAHTDGIAGIPAFSGSDSGHGGSASRAQLWVR